MRRISKRAWTLAGGTAHPRPARCQRRGRWQYFALDALLTLAASSAACGDAYATIGTGPSLTLGAVPIASPASPLPWRWDVWASAPGCAVARPVPSLALAGATPAHAYEVAPGRWRVTYAPADRYGVVVATFVADPQLKAGSYALC